VSPFCSLFSQILKFISRSDFEGQVRKLSAERHARGVSCWQQFGGSRTFHVKTGVLSDALRQGTM
jgi:Domain of unknown function (DUF4372)